MLGEDYRDSVSEAMKRYKLDSSRPSIDSFIIYLQLCYRDIVKFKRKKLPPEIVYYYILYPLLLEKFIIYFDESQVMNILKIIENSRIRKTSRGTIKIKIYDTNPSVLGLVESLLKYRYDFVIHSVLMLNVPFPILLFNAIKSFEQRHSPKEFYILLSQMSSNIRTSIFNELVHSSIYDKKLGNMLLRLGIKPNFEFSILGDRCNNPVIHNIIERSGSMEALSALKDFGFDINLKDESGNSPLITAIVLHRIEFVRFFVENGAERVSDSRGRTPFFLSCVTRNMEMVELLLPKSRNELVTELTTARDYDGSTKLTPIQLAYRTGQLQLLTRLSTLLDANISYQVRTPSSSRFSQLFTRCCGR